MNERELFKETFHNLHASNQTAEEVLKMAVRGKRVKRFIKEYGYRNSGSINEYSDLGCHGWALEQRTAAPSTGNNRTDAGVGRKRDCCLAFRY